MDNNELLQKINDNFLEIRKEIDTINQVTTQVYIDNLIKKGFITKVGQRYRVDNLKEGFGDLKHLIKKTTISNKGTFITFLNESQIDKLSKQIKKSGY